VRLQQTDGDMVIQGPGAGTRMLCAAYDYGIWYFIVPEEYRVIIRRTDVAEPYSDGSRPT
jgi:hypothetical protein